MSSLGPLLFNSFLMCHSLHSCTPSRADMIWRHSVCCYLRFLHLGPCPGLPFLDKLECLLIVTSPPSNGALTPFRMCWVYWNLMHLDTVSLAVAHSQAFPPIYCDVFPCVFFLPLSFVAMPIVFFSHVSLCWIMCLSVLSHLPCIISDVTMLLLNRQGCAGFVSQICDLLCRL